MDKEKIAIAIDGPAGSGKSTISKIIAEILNIEYIDTGAMYRALTLKVLRLGLDAENDDHAIIGLLADTKIDFINNSIYLDEMNVDKEIRENIVSKNVSYIARIKEVRDYLVKSQQEMSKRKSLIMDGRDIGTVVLPQADFKFFITASVGERAKRRYKELLEKGEAGISLKEIEKEIEKRDEIDSNRAVSPLIKAHDAYLIDSTNKDIEKTKDEILAIIKGR